MMQPVKKTPQEWAAEAGAEILDPDGWRRPDSPAFDEPLTYDEFLPRFYISTIRKLETVLGANCRSGCKTRDHISWGECARAANTRLGNLK